MRKYKYLILTFFLALFLRTVLLGSLPVGFHADEVRVGWNAYSILKTGLDDRGNFLALYYNTFGDYRPTGIFYLTIPSLFLFGLTEFAVRFPSALMGALTVFPIYALVYQVTKNKKMALGSSFYLAISPWHISTSRATSEVVVSIFFAVSALYFLVCGLKEENRKRLFWAFGAFLVSYLFYHSIRLLAPLLSAAILFYYKDKVRGTLFKQSAYFLIGLLFLTIVLAIYSGGTERFEQVSVFGSKEVAQVLSAADSIEYKTFFDHKYVVYLKEFMGEYFEYFTFDFFVGDKVLPIRYWTPGVGLMTYSALFLLLAGAYYSLVEKKHRLFLCLFFVSAIPAGLTVEDSPNLHRSMMMLPMASVLVAYGFLNIKKRILYGNLLLGLILVAFLINWFHYLVSYTNRAEYEIGFWRNAGVREMVVYLNEVQGNYDKVYITNDPDDPYAWYAFYNRLDPLEFNEYAVTRRQGEWEYENLIFTTRECPSGDILPGKYDDYMEEDVLVIDGFKCPVESKISDGMKGEVLRQFHNPDGEVYYTLWVPSRN